jgi:hypothetical protein|tara:strand:- start:13153 stop:14361 length:1209 start_codon:yes stop_codon:yes gene_type:complete
MLQIDHIYEFLHNSVFKDFELHAFEKGVPTESSYIIFNKTVSPRKILFYDQEPILDKLSDPYLDYFNIPYTDIAKNRKQYPELYNNILEGNELDDYIAWYTKFVKKPFVLVTSEKSIIQKQMSEKYGFENLYYFYHGFAALDWFRGYQALNYDKEIVREYDKDFITYNRLIKEDRSYRIYLVSLLKEYDLLDKGFVSFGVTDAISDWRDEISDPKTRLSEQQKDSIERNLTDITRLTIDNASVLGSASADIPREQDAFWHVVTETVFYHSKMHLTEKIFKPIVNKQPFMLLAAPDNLAYLKSYGFKTFDSVIDEDYDICQDNQERINKVVSQLHWYANLSPGDKTDVQEHLKPIIEHNFNHFYGEFRHIIAKELITNTKSLFNDINYTSQVDWQSIHQLLTS